MRINGCKGTRSYLRRQRTTLDTLKIGNIAVQLADEWRFACDYNGCGVIARYDEFISVFGASMTTPSMTPAALEAALKAIDARMADKLGKKPVATPTSNPN